MGIFSKSDQEITQKTIFPVICVLLRLNSQNPCQNAWLLIQIPLSNFGMVISTMPQFPHLPYWYQRPRIKRASTRKALRTEPRALLSSLLWVLGLSDSANISWVLTVYCWSHRHTMKQTLPCKPQTLPLNPSSWHPRPSPEVPCLFCLHSPWCSPYSFTFSGLHRTFTHLLSFKFSEGSELPPDLLPPGALMYPALPPGLPYPPPSGSCTLWALDFHSAFHHSTC